MRPGTTDEEPLQLFRLGDDPQIRLWVFPASRILFLSLFVGNVAADDHVIPWLPIHRRGDFVLGCELHGIEDAQYLIEVASGAHGVAELELDLFIRTHNEYGAHRGVVGSSAPIGTIPALGRQHAVELGYLELRVTDHRIIDLGALGLFNIRCPLAVTAYGVDT